MKTSTHAELIALDIEIFPTLEAGELVQPNTLRALQFNLRSFYREVFVWSLNDRLAIWIIGSRKEYLVRSFLPFHDSIKRLVLHESDQAEELFFNIIKGRAWNENNAIQKTISLNNCYESSVLMDGVNEKLFPMIAEGLLQLNNSDIINGSQNAWKYSQHLQPEQSLLDKIQVRTRNLFYRFSIN